MTFKVPGGPSVLLLILPPKGPPSSARDPPNIYNVLTRYDFHRFHDPTDVGDGADGEGFARSPYSTSGCVLTVHGTAGLVRKDLGVGEGTSARSRPATPFRHTCTGLGTNAGPVEDA